MLAGEVTAVEVNEARARELEETARRLGADGRPGRRRRRSCASGRAHGLRSRARGCAVLGARRSQQPPRPAVARRAASRAPARAPSLRRRARAPGRHDRLLRLHDQRGRVRGGGRRVRARGRHDPRGGVAAVQAFPPARSSCRRCRTSTARRGSSSRASSCVEDPPRLLDVLLEPPGAIVPGPGEVVSDPPAAGARSRSKPSSSEHVEPA